MSQLEAYLALEYPPYTTKRYSEEQNSSIPSEISSNKLTDLGFEYKYGLVDIIKQSVGSCLQHGFLEHVALARQQHDSE